jgi:uncharacterized protein (TIGR03546 family)
MFLLIKVLKKFFKIFNSAAAPWQVALGVLLGTLVGFLPIFSKAYGPAPLGLALIVIAVILNCHLTAFLLFVLLGKLLSLVLISPALAIGGMADGLAQTSANIPFLHASLWSHTGWLGMTLIGFVLAPIFATLMWWATWNFRVKLRDRLIEKRKLVAAGKLAGNLFLVKAVCWFFDL